MFTNLQEWDGPSQPSPLRLLEGRMGIIRGDDKPDARIRAGVDYVIRKLIVAYEKNRDRIRKEFPIYV